MRPQIQTLSQFDAMSEIYQSAYLTIVGAAGQDSQARLPGIRPSPRRVSRVTELVDGTYPGSTYQVISNTKWNTRAWTYQEMLLSKRILVFTDEEVLCECDSEGAWRESVFAEHPGVHQVSSAFPHHNRLSNFDWIQSS